ncbi:MAG: dockerin type I repeat-containing protein, partial [Prevotella sp.]|nr:dockerin type I repeat-containing protein [Prevotella sp.]
IFTRADYGVMRNKLQDLWKEEWFKEAVLNKWNSIVSSDVKATLKTKLNSLADEIAQTRDYNYKALTEGGAGWTLEGYYEDKVTEISTYLDNRFAYLDKKFNELANAEIEDVLLGDVNGSGHIDVTDVVMEVNYILGEEPESFVFKNADMNGDKTINISDVMEIINIILNQD